MKSLDELLQKLWEDYASMNKQAGSIHQLLTEKGENVANDHIAFRTFNDPRIGVNVLSQPFLKFGYEQKGTYEFEAKKLHAHHYEHPEDHYPRIFISELKVEEFSNDLQSTVMGLVNQVPEEITQKDDFPLAGVLWDKVSYDTYTKLKEESEYAAWMSVFGFRVNHFTVFINSLKNHKEIEDFNEFLKSNGYTLNDSGGEIKGTPNDYLEQSSTMADPVEVDFSDGKKTIPGCYYEFAKRYPMPDGKLFMGFVAKSADKIFESTDNKKEKSN